MKDHANALNGDRFALGEGPASADGLALVDTRALVDRLALVDRSALDVGGFPADAFIYPDEPLVLDKFREALIHPDEPFIPREEERGVVVGMDGSAEHEPRHPGVGLLDPGQVADLLEAVSMDLRKNGIDSLRSEVGSSSVETDLRTHLAEYFLRQH